MRFLLNLFVLLLFSISAFCQDFTVIKGIVKYEDDDAPVIGASVQVKGTGLWAVTDR